MASDCSQGARNQNSFFCTMDTKENKAVADALEKQLEKVRQQIQELEQLTQPIAPENAIGRVSRMDAINNRSVNEAALRKARVKKRQLEHNASRLDHPDFGRCRRCGEAIQIERLLFMPESSLCTACARRA